MPDATAPGGAEFALTVNGTGFVSGAVVNWNGSSLATTFASGVGTSAGRTIAVRAWRWEQALQEEINPGLLLPCNAVVYERDGQILVGLVDAVKMLSVVRNPRMEKLAKQVTDSLRRVVDSVAKRT